MKPSSFLLVAASQLLTMILAVYTYISSDQNNVALSLLVLVTCLCLLAALSIFSPARPRIQIFGTIFSIQLATLVLTFHNNRFYSKHAYGFAIINCVIARDVYFDSYDYVRKKSWHVPYILFQIIPLALQGAYSLLMTSLDVESALLIVSLSQCGIYVIEPIRKLLNENNEAINCDNVFSQREHKVVAADVNDLPFAMVRSVQIENSSQLCHSLSTDLIVQSVDVMTEGVIILKSEANQNFKVHFMNKAARNLFQANNQVELFNQLNSLSLVKLPRENDAEMCFSAKLFNQQIKLCRSLFIPSNNLGLSSQRQVVEPTWDNHQKTSMMKLLEQVVNQKRQNQTIVHSVIQNSQSSTPSNEIIIELAIFNKPEKQVIIIARDVTHKQKIRYLKEYDIQKSKMLSFVSHEYRAPLNCIVEMLSQVLASPGLSTQNQENLRIAIECSSYILNLSNDLLDLAQIKNNKFSLHKSTFDLYPLCQECLGLFSTKGKLQQLSLDFICNIDSHNRQVTTDRNRLKQIMINLLSNAFKFTRTTVQIIAEKQEDHITLGVKDDGIGISEDDRKMLFKAFSKVNSEESRKLNQQGVGLGLLISNQIAHQIAISGIQFHSEENRGSFFYLELPLSHRKVSIVKCREILIIDPVVTSDHTMSLDQKQKLNQKPSIEQKPTIDISGCQHILIVDDEIFNIEILRNKLKALQQLSDNRKIVDIDFAQNGRDAISKALEKQCSRPSCSGYKLIFMDIELPLMNGYAAARQILQKRPLQTIVGCSAHMNEEQSCLLSGMCDYLTKPVSNDALQDILKRHYF